MDSDDSILLRSFVEQDSERAFRQLVEQRLGFVYATALRHVRGDVHLAQDVTQAVFSDLARNARRLVGRASLAGWLYTSARYAAGKALRSRARQLRRESDAHAEQHLQRSGPAVTLDWTELRLVIDAALSELSGGDREAILLRFFQERSLAEVGHGLGIAENAARMRVDRALERLRQRLVRRGITSTSAALALALASQPVVAAPAGFAEVVTETAMAKCGAGLIAAWAGMSFMAKSTLIGLIVVAGVAAWSGARMIAQQPDHRESTTLPPAPPAPPPTSDGTVADRTTAAGVAPRSASPTLYAVQRPSATRTSAGNLLQVRRGKLQPAVIALLSLSDAEQSQVVEALATTQSQVNRLAAKNVQSTVRAAPDTFLIRINPFPTEGITLRDRFLARLTAILGADRVARLRSEMGSSFDLGAARGFGLVGRTLTVARQKMPTATGEIVLYSVNDTTEPAQGTISRSSEAHVGLTRQALQQTLAEIATLLPADF